ncbi:MAG TPA: helix-turn-helix domain-containing protein [Alphaproteobacteria bacterium]|nr:helix-turn-helix domain-containing protein [Alphaproteobacteria bacterium]
MASDARMTVPAALLRPMLDALSARGVAVDDVLQCPGGTLSWESLFEDQGPGLDRDDFVHAYGTCTCLLEQAICRPRAKSGLRRKAFELFFDTMVAASDLRDACGRAAEFNAMMEERGYTLALAVHGDAARFTIDFNPSIVRSPPALIVAAMVFFHNVFSWLTAAPIGLLRIGLVSPRGEVIDPALGVLGVPVVYGQAENFLEFHRTDLDREVIRGPSDFVGMVDYIAYDPLFFFRPEMPMADRIRTMLLDCARRGEPIPDSIAAADGLQISISTLSRRLRRENTTYLKLKATCQQEVAKQLLRREALSVAQVATRLGFVDARSFRRAFLGWTGVLPSVFRANAAGDLASDRAGVRPRYRGP